MKHVGNGFPINPEYFFVMKFNRKYAWNMLVDAQAFNTPFAKLCVIRAGSIIPFFTKRAMDLWYGKLQSQKDKRKILFLHLAWDLGNPSSLSGSLFSTNNALMNVQTKRYELPFCAVS